MKTLIFATPITMEEANSLGCFDYSVLYLNSSNKKLKLASADYTERYHDNSEIHEAFKSDAIMFLKHVKEKSVKETSRNIMTLVVNDNCEVESITNNCNRCDKMPILDGVVLAKRLK